MLLYADIDIISGVSLQKFELNGELIFMRKNALLALVLALTLLLSGCNLVVKDQSVDDNQVVISYGDTVINKKEFNERMDTLLAEEEQFYSSYGMTLDRTDPEIIADAQNFVVEEFEESVIRDMKLQEWGLNELTEEDKPLVDERTKEEMDSLRETIRTYYVADPTLEGDALEAEVDRLMEYYGVTEEDVRAEVEQEILQEKYKAEIVKDVTVSDEDIAAKYDELVAADTTTYEGKAGSWASAFNNGSKLYYTPEGVRFVKQILIKYTEEDQKVLDEINDLIGNGYTDYYAAQQSLYYLGVTDYADAVASINVTVTPAEENAGEYYTGAVTTDYNADALDASIPEEQKDLYIQMAVAQATEDFYREQLEKARAVALTHLDAEADDVLAQLESGADWEALMAEKTQDPGMQEGAATAETGYAVAADMTGFDSAFVEGAMAIANPGENSGKIYGAQYGYYIIKYISDAEAGAVAQDQMADAIRETVLTEKQNACFSETVEKWISEAGFKVDLSVVK